MSLKVDLKNIGGLQGEHSFTFKKNLNILSSPNATGKSSLLKGIYLLMVNENIPSELLNDILTERELEGYVRVNYNDKQYEVQLQRKKNSIEISYFNVSKEIFPSQTLHLGLLIRNSELYEGISNDDPLIIKNWFSNMTEVHKFELFFEISQRIYNDFKEKIRRLDKDVQNDILDRKSQIKNLDNEINEFNNQIEQDRQSPPYQKYLSDHNKEERELENLSKKIDNLENKISKKKRKKIEANNQSEKEIKNLKEKKQILEDFRKERPIIKARLKTITLKVDNIKTKINNILEELDNIEDDLKKTKNLYKDYKQLENREECPLCHQKLNREIIKNFVDELNKRIDNLKIKKENLDKNKRYLELEKRDLDKEYDKLKKRILLNEAKIKTEIENLKLVVSNKNEEIENLNNKIGVLEEELNNNQLAKENLLKKLNSEADNKFIRELNKKREELSSKKRLKIKYQREIDEFERSQVELKNFIKKSELAEIIKDHYVSKVHELLLELTDKINQRLEESFELLRLAELEKITISTDGNYKIDIQRKNKVYTTLSKMSGAEKELIILIIFFIVQRTIIPNLPIFLIDEVTSDMDDTRFKDVLGYISKEVEKVIVARHIPFDGKKQTIKNEQIISS